MGCPLDQKREGFIVAGASEATTLGIMDPGIKDRRLGRYTLTSKRKEAKPFWFRLFNLIQPKFLLVRVTQWYSIHSSSPYYDDDDYESDQPYWAENP